MITLGVDASVTASGYALVEYTPALGPVLIDAGVVRASSVAEAIARVHIPIGRAPDAAVLEIPRVYPTAKQPGDPNALISIAAVTGAWGCEAVRRNPGCALYLRHPSAWKGHIDKKVVRLRVLEALRVLDAQIDYALAAVPSSLRHNAIEAIGLALAGPTGRL